MVSLLIAVIYLAFVSLGLPDSLLGSAWPVMYQELGVGIDAAGLISMIICIFTIISSLMSDFVTHRLGTGLVTAISTALTALALLGFSLSKSYWMLCVLAVPYGLGAGAIDAAMNNYVALHYGSRQMSWLHCFWGVGASISPYIMGFALSRGWDWTGGYQAVSLIQMALAAVLFASLPIWRRHKQDTSSAPDAVEEAHIGIRGAILTPGVIPILIAFMAYCSYESTAGLWAATFLVEFKGVDSHTAANFASMFYLGITIGRFACGFIADRFGDKTMIRMGLSIAAFGIVLMLLPLPGKAAALAGLLILGMGSAPVYPSIIHSTPIYFGRENSHAIVGVQMASAYTGSTFMPPLFGLIARHSAGWYPLYLGMFVAITLLMCEYVNRLTAGRRKG